MSGSHADLMASNIFLGLTLNKYAQKESDFTLACLRLVVQSTFSIPRRWTSMPALCIAHKCFPLSMYLVHFFLPPFTNELKVKRVVQIFSLEFDFKYFFLYFVV